MDRIAANVHHGTAGKFHVPTRIIRIGERERHVHIDVLQFTELTGSGQLHHSRDYWVVSVVEGLHELHVRRRDGIANRARLGRITRRWLFAEHMLARRDRPEVPWSVQPIRQGVVDRFDLGIVDHRLVGIENPLNIAVSCELLRSTSITGGNRHESVSGGTRWADDRGVANSRGAEYSDSQRFHDAEP